jgi:hypothetical protein
VSAGSPSQCCGSSLRSSRILREETYSASDVADFVAKDHRTSVFITIALGLLSVLGLLLLLAGFRERIADRDSLTATVSGAPACCL